MSPFLAIILCLLNLHLPSSDAARILVTAAVDSGTHIGSMVPLIKRLASSGHSVTVLEIATLSKPRDLGPNVTMVFLPVPEDEGIAASLSASMFRTVLNGRILHLPYLYGDEKFKEYMLSHAQLFRSLLHTPFDLVILDELFGVHSFALALHLYRHHGVPYIIYSTTMMIQSSAYCLSLGRNFVSEPNLLTSPPLHSGDKYNPRWLLNRLDNLRTVVWDLFRVHYQVELLLRAPSSSLHLLGVPDFTFHEFFSRASSIFADYLDRAPVPMAESPSILPISAQCSRSRPLPPDLAQFVDHPSSNGTIYVPFGTNLQWRHAPDQILRAFFGAFNRLSHYRILFSFNNGILPPDLVIGSHIKLVSWAPQYDVLSHPRTKLFISHGGLKSFKETLCSKIPAVYMPVYAEQSYNTKVAIRSGFATAVHKLTVTQEVLFSAINQVLSDHRRFKVNAERANAFFLDRPLGGMEMAEFGVRRALKEGGRGWTRGQRVEKWRIRRGMNLGPVAHTHLDLVLALTILALFLAIA